ncbi:hypothetical protein [Fictibacillus fluitans]|uniref:Uncharacterized protein n=1 Tax=Fictibacillus fluitans TaxID=3058422 RepID=A0ABT8HQY1_9BACL|nr:hypothetical protein [Fictibacillus sp. NE201]MDN4523176.1 hypothetical protein [Fictibacillus sp. NE201]
MPFELGHSGPLKKYTISDIREKAINKMNEQQKGELSIKSNSTKLDTKSSTPSENNFLEGLGEGKENASWMDDKSGKHLDALQNKMRREREQHDKEMKRLLGNDYKNPVERLREASNKTNWLDGLK